ncbi:unnamed protein product [Acanthoscelides obtectus]|uniref:Uncharacterized protein n=1 Tax=Acanthoscelides obtectus TaxID=200917 RepID=A0A9P0LTS1_ACAOB|nr:unnamed protein product [Acanthoscelides obtectus]CAK1675382.1 hypothetical protein AOBTE_LOCUS30184 [Acanthoscelides obtectus]
MAFKLVVLLATLAYANAGFLYSSQPTAYSVATPGALTSQSSNIYRSFGNLGQISTYSKTVDTPYSSVSKSDVRVSNPGVRFAAPALATYAAPAVAAHATYAAPAIATHATYAAPAIAAHTTYAAPAIAAHATYAAPAIAAHAAYAAPAAVAHGPLLGVAYSAAPAVSHISYASGYANYAF